MSEITGRQPETMREEIVQNNGPSREEQDKLTKRKRIACCFCLVVCIIGYICVLKIVDFFTSYIEFRCFIINSTVIETISCNGYNTSPLFLARWTVNISQDHFVPHHYLSQINQRFTFYYKAQEVISTTHIIGSQDKCYVYKREKYNVYWEKQSISNLENILCFVAFVFLFFCGCVTAIDTINKNARRQIS